MIASVGQPPFGSKCIGTIRSALFFARQRRLEFHLIVDEPGEASMREAIGRVEPWLLQKASFNYIKSASLEHVWKLVRDRVSEECLHTTRRYGSVGWLRMWPHEVFRERPDM